MKIVIDYREKRGGVIEELQRLDAGIEFAALQVADYVVSDRVAFERKTVDDLFATMLDRRELFSQLMDISRSYRLPILIMEGEVQITLNVCAAVYAIAGAFPILTRTSG